MPQLPSSEFTKIPYLDPSVLGDRSVRMMPLWDGAVWRQWFEADGRLMEMRIVDAVRSNYVAKAPAIETDLRFTFTEFMWQHANWPDVGRLTLAVCEDFHLIGTSVAKLRHFFNLREQIDKTLIGSFVQTELEYLLTVARSVFDLLQEIIAVIWNKHIQLVDANAEARRRQRGLPQTFSKIVLREKDALRSADEIAVKFGLPPALAELYASLGTSFAHLRTWRDRIVHGGASVDTIFVTERGFGVFPTHPAFADFAWSDAHRYNDSIVSLLPWVANVVRQPLMACTQMAITLNSVVTFPPAVAPGYGIFVRDPANAEIILMQRVVDGELVWWDQLPAGSSVAAGGGRGNT